MINLLFILTSLCLAREPLTLDYSVELQEKYHDPTGDVWRTIESTRAMGLQAFLDPLNTYRIKIVINKPYDLSGTFRARMPNRSQAVVASSNSNSVQILFEEPPISLSDIGQIELRLDLEKATTSSYTVILFRPYDMQIKFSATPSISYDGKEIKCGDKVKKGFWIFAKNLLGEASPIDLISFCVVNPKAEFKCAKNDDKEISTSVTEKGEYTFIAWSNNLTSSRCTVYGE